MILIRRLPGLIYSYRYKFLVSLILSCTLLYFLIRWNIFCTNYQTWQHIERMCQLYDEGYAMGTLCSPICAADSIDSFTCHSFKSNKEAVFSVNLKKTHLVFKSISSQVHPLHWYDNGILKYPTENEFYATIHALLRQKFNTTFSAKEIHKLAHLVNPDVHANRQKEIDNLWTLLQDNEYLLSAIYGQKSVFPDLIGTCGAYYAVEYLRPVPHSSAFVAVSDNSMDWSRKLRIAVQMLDLLEEFEFTFHEPIHLCDVRLEHFGLSDVDRMKFMDLDAVYPRSVIGRMFHEQLCRDDVDCELLDCRSKCMNGKCMGRVLNDNFQVVCEKIFLGWRMSNTVIVPGLLMSQHTPAELATVLRQCAHPDGDNLKARSVPDEEVRKRLYNILVEIEQSVNNNEFLR